MTSPYVIDSLKAFLSSPKITPTGHALTVLDDLQPGNVGFIDRLLRLDLLEQADMIATFDKAFARLDHVQDIAAS